MEIIHHRFGPRAGNAIGASSDPDWPRNRHLSTVTGDLFRDENVTPPPDAITVPLSDHTDVELLPHTPRSVSWVEWEQVRRVGVG